MALFYQSTRGKETGVTASQAILKGLAEDGGLFMPTEIPVLSIPMKELAGMSYQETAYEVMKLFLTDYTEEELKDCIAKAYDDKFDVEEIAPLAKADGMYFLELFHGKTIAFKGYVRRYGKSGNGRICRRTWDTDYCILSKRRGQQSPGTADAYPERE